MREGQEHSHALASCRKLTNSLRREGVASIIFSRHGPTRSATLSASGGILPNKLLKYRVAVLLQASSGT